MTSELGSTADAARVGAAAVRSLAWRQNQGMVDQVGRRLGHAPGSARRTKPTALAAEGDQLVVPAVTAAQAQEAVGQDAAFENLIPNEPKPAE